MITAAEMRVLIAAGVSAEVIAAAVEAGEREIRDHKRELGRLRVQRHRNARKRYSNAVTRYSVTPSEHIETAEEFRLDVENEENGAYKKNLTSSIEDSLRKKERVGVTRARAKPVPLPDDWKPPERSYALAASLGVSVLEVEGRFRDWLAAKGMQYVNYDAGFCNFIRNAPKFSGNGNGRAKDARTRILEEVFGGNDGGRGQAVDGDNTGLLPGFARR